MPEFLWGHPHAGRFAGTFGQGPQNFSVGPAHRIKPVLYSLWPHAKGILSSHSVLLSASFILPVAGQLMLAQATAEHLGEIHL